MGRRQRTLGILAAAGLASACGDFGETPDSVVQVSEALSVCEETVPADRQVDGIPAYDQCTESESASIFSNNGVDTSTTSLGTDWVETQRSGGYQCTELAHRYLYFRWNIDWIPRGNAGTWCDSTPPSDSGVVQTSTPVHGDILVFPPGSCGADSTYGHVAVVDTVDSSERVTIVEQNRAGRRGVDISCATCFLHVVANDGSVGSGGASGTGGAQASTGGESAATGGVPVATGGVPSTGGVPAATGGTVVATGGVPVATGGMAVATGGALGATGGTPAAVGGAPTASGGASTAVGGFAPAMGGASPAAGGFPAAGGMTAAGGTAAAPAGSGASPAASGGTSGIADPTVPPVVTDADDDAGCGCRVAGHGTPGGLGKAFALLGLGIAGALVRRRRGVRRA